MNSFPHPAGQVRGVVLPTAMIILLVVSILAVSMLRSFGNLERIADSTRDKQRAFNAAQSTLRYAEWWLTQGNASPGTPCAATYSANTAPATARVCSNALVSTAPTVTQAQVSEIPWKTAAGVALGNEFTPPGMTGKVSSTGGADTYATVPLFYVTAVGNDPKGIRQLYQVTATASGGSRDSVAVVQSVFGVSSDVTDAGGL